MNAFCSLRLCGCRVILRLPVLCLHHCTSAYSHCEATSAYNKPYGPQALNSPAMKLSALSLVLLLCMQVACGFTLRGTNAEQSSIGAVFIDAGRDVQLADLVRRKIREQGLTLATSRDVANVLVRLTGENQGQRVVSVQSEGRVSEFELRHGIDLLVIRAEPGEIARYGSGGENRSDTVAVRREYTFDDTGVLGKEDEASILRRELRDELARQLVLRIIAGA